MALEKFEEKVLPILNQKLVEANVFIPWVELVQSTRRGDNG
jgi:hypothetical protein